MSTQVSIERAEPHHIDEIAPLFDAYRRFYNRTDDPRARSFLEERVTRQESVVFLARMQGGAIGFCQLYPCFASVSLLQRLSGNCGNEQFYWFSGRRKVRGSHLFSGPLCTTPCNGDKRPKGGPRVIMRKGGSDLDRPSILALHGPRTHDEFDAAFCYLRARCALYCGTRAACSMSCGTIVQVSLPGGTMAFHVRRIDYFSTTVRDDPGEAYKLLAILANLGVNLLAFTAVPIGPLHTQLTIFPEDSAKLTNEAKKNRLVLDGPHPALLVQGDDELGALAELHMKLTRANVNVYASTGVADGRGSFGYVIYVRPEQYNLAVAALGL